jgi:hypothetical protein
VADRSVARLEAGGDRSGTPAVPVWRLIAHRMSGWRYRRASRGACRAAGGQAPAVRSKTAVIESVGESSSVSSGDSSGIVSCGGSGTVSRGPGVGASRLYAGKSSTSVSSSPRSCGGPAVQGRVGGGGAGVGRGQRMGRVCFSTLGGLGATMVSVLLWEMDDVRGDLVVPTRDPWGPGRS